ncbi:hypothetical protein [Verrucosispora sp. NA02020]|uniref:hypothetical protein n=1 Tax=Verrucosispora sp. NA02020 TaxID=2742132 RepID=UPI001591017C|nr:hypothetical protein [Verrucosispora sp. NA02020]QKW15473.1 hypothetical protein HUT12_23680 [Verrucosispora sp. NA02020]
MPRQPFAHQDACGAAGTRYAVFVNSVFIEYVDTKTDPYGYAAMDRILAAHAPARPSIETLMVCVEHPTTAAVDCLICDPED